MPVIASGAKQLDATVPDGKTVIIIYIRYTQKPAFNDCF